MTRTRFAERQLVWLQYCYQQRLLDEQIAKAQQHAKTLSARLSPPSDWEEWELPPTPTPIPMSRGAHSSPHAAARVSFAGTALVGGGTRVTGGALELPKTLSSSPAPAASSIAGTGAPQPPATGASASGLSSTSNEGPAAAAAAAASGCSTSNSTASASKDKSSQVTADSFLVTLVLAISLLGRRLLASASHNNHLAEYIPRSRTSDRFELST